MLDFDSLLPFDSANDEDFFSALPPFAGVCLIEGKTPSAEPLFIRTQDMRRRLQRLLGRPDAGSKRLNLREFAGQVRYRVTASAFEQTLAYYQHAKQIFPKRYRDMLRMRPPAVLKVNLQNPYPRCYPSRRIAVDASGEPAGGVYFGPFPSRRAAEAFAEGVLDFFKVRRCRIKILRDPAFPGCIYSEMKMCLAPCFGGCSKEEYASEVARLVAFLESGGGSLRAEFENERARASEGLQFELAAAFHKKIEKLDGALRGQPELTRRIQDLQAVILQRANGEQAIAAYAVRRGMIDDAPLEIHFGEIAGQPRSAEQFFREYLEKTPARRAGNSEELSEHLWLLARWYYGNPRQGEIFFLEKDWPYRKMMRACSRLLAPPEDGKPQNPAS